MYLGALDYPAELPNINYLEEQMRGSEYISSIDSWYDSLVTYTMETTGDGKSPIIWPSCICVYINLHIDHTDYLVQTRWFVLKLKWEVTKTCILIFVKLVEEGGAQAFFL